MIFLFPRDALSVWRHRFVEGLEQIEDFYDLTFKDKITKPEEGSLGR